MNISFHDTLWNMRNEDLLLRLKLLKVKPEIKHKGGLIDTLKRAYAGDGLRRMWETLSELEQAAVAEAVYHSDHRFQGGIWGADDLWWISRYDGLRAFRLTELGAYFIGMEADFVPSPSTSTLVLEVGGNLVIRHKSGTLEPADRLLLEAWAEKIEPDAWRLNRELALSAVERGQKAEDVAAFLRSRDPQPLPQTVEGFLIGAERDGQAVRFSSEALLFECRDEETAERICLHKTLATLCHRSGRKTITVPVAHAEKFRDGVRKLGLGVV